MDKGIILPHNVKPASVWNAGGEGYDDVSRTIADSIETGTCEKPGQAST